MSAWERSISNMGVAKQIADGWSDIVTSLRFHEHEHGKQKLLRDAGVSFNNAALSARTRQPVPMSLVRAAEQGLMVVAHLMEGEL